MAKSTYTKEERKAQFLATGLKLARKNGIAKVSVAAVAAEHKVTAPLVFHIFGSRDNLQAAIKREAKKQGVIMAEPKAAAPAPKRKRSIAEVKAIKDKAAASKSKVAVPAKVAASKSKVAKKEASKPKVAKKAAPAPAKKPKVAAPAKKAAPKVTAPKVKYPTQPVPTAPVDLSANANPTNTL